MQAAHTPLTNTIPGLVSGIKHCLQYFMILATVKNEIINIKTCRDAKIHFETN